METAIRWSSNSTLSEQRFLLADVNGRSFNLNKVQQYDGKSFESQALHTYRKVPHFRAFDWAPFDESLVAVGQWSGETTVLRIDDAAQAVALPAKHQRLCNAVAFGRTGLLATGLERVRNVECLNIWDVNQRLASRSPPGPGGGRSNVESYRKFASSEAISSIKFFAGQPEVLIAGVKGIGTRIYDLRENTANPSLQFQTSRVHNIALDPLDENYFACAGSAKDTTVQVWDCRSGSPYITSSTGSGSDESISHSPVLEYAEAFGTARQSAQVDIWSLRFCKGKSGLLGVLTSNGEFKVFETSRGYTQDNQSYSSQQDTGLQMANVFAERIFTKRVHHVEQGVNDIHKSRKEIERIVAFDFTNLAGSKGTPCAIILRGDQSINIHELSGPPTAVTLSALGGLAVSKANHMHVKLHDHSGQDPFLNGTIHTIQSQQKQKAMDLLRLLRGKSSVTPKDQPANNAELNNEEVIKAMPRSSRESHEHLLSSYISSQQLDAEDALASFTIARRRCAEGYLFDGEKNAEILGDDPWLQSLWFWIERAQHNAQNGLMVAEGLDFSFLGVSSIWNNNLNPQRSLETIDKSQHNANINEALRVLAHRLSLPDFTTVETTSPHHRQLCLHTCGLGLSFQSLETTVKGFVRDGQNTKAAALAVIHDQPKLAFEALRNGRATPANRELSLALAGYVKGQTDDTWEQTIQDLVKDSEDPYARAILALVSYGDWHDVLVETSLPLRDRVGIALMYLEDEELTQYIDNTTAEAIKEGDIEGIVLTGLSETSIALFEKYMQKSSDLQTAVLALSFTCPRYFTDPRVTIWRATYRTHLNRWRMFIPRAQFDIQSTKLSTPPKGKPTLPPPPRQVTLRCNNCQLSLDRNRDNDPPLDEGSKGSHGTHQGSIFGGAKSGTVCPRCGQHMPRCVICMHWLGMPDTHTKGGAAAMKGKQEGMDKFLSVCRSCWHMSHGHHAEAWFEEHEFCPVPGCECRCAKIDAGIV